LPAHIHLEIERANKAAGNFTTEVQFDDDRRLTAAWRKRSKQEGFVIGTVKRDSKNRYKVEVELKMR
jgi:hypothetical protein